MTGVNETKANINGKSGQKIIRPLTSGNNPVTVNTATEKSINRRRGRASTSTAANWVYDDKSKRRTKSTARHSATEFCDDQVAIWCRPPSCETRRNIWLRSWPR